MTSSILPFLILRKRCWSACTFFLVGEICISPLNVDGAGLDICGLKYQLIAHTTKTGNTVNISITHWLEYVQVPLLISMPCLQTICAVEFHSKAISGKNLYLQSTVLNAIFNFEVTQRRSCKRKHAKVVLYGIFWHA